MDNLIFDHTDRWGDQIILISAGTLPRSRRLEVELRPSDGRVVTTGWWPGDVRRLHRALADHLASTSEPKRRVLWQSVGTTNSELAAMVGTSDLVLRIGDVDSVRLDRAALKALMRALADWLASTQPEPGPVAVPAPGLEERVAALEEVVQRLTHGITDLLQILQGGRNER